MTNSLKQDKKIYKTSKLTFRSKEIFNQHTSLEGLLFQREYNDIDTFKDKVLSIIFDFEKNEDSHIFIKTLFNELNTNELVLDNIKDYKKYLLDIIEDNYNDNNKDFFISFISRLLKIGGNKISINNMSSSNIIKYNYLTNFSRKKLLVKELLEKYPKVLDKKKSQVNRKKRKQLISDAQTINTGDDKIFDALIDVYSSPHIEFMGRLAAIFGESTDLTKRESQVMANYAHSYDEYEKEIFIKMLKDAGFGEKVINSFLDKDEENTNDNIIDLFKDQELNGEENDNLLKVSAVSRSKFNDFNPMIMDLDFETGIKAFGFKRFRDIYKGTFSRISENIINEVKGIKPLMNSIFKVDTNFFKDKSKEENSKKDNANNYVYQYLLEWDVKKGLEYNELQDLARLLDSVFGDINFNKDEEYKRFRHPVKTSENTMSYRGFFDESGTGFSGDYIIELKNEKSKADKSRKIRLCLNGYTQDIYIYLMTQVSYYLKHKKFIDDKQLYTNIYHKYALEYMGDEKMYDISMLGENYENIMENVIIPLSIEGKDLDIKALNSLLVGLYGVGKSQFLLNLFLRKKFEYKGVEFNFNAVVIDLNVGYFKQMIMNDFGGFKTKLEDIQQKTGLPIVLIVEDLSTILNEKLHGVNDEISQKLTTTLEGIGSLPVTIIASDNHPERVPFRLTRPMRFENILFFDVPDIETKKEFFEIYLKDFKINLSDNVKDYIYDTKLFKKGTSSHIHKIVKDIDSRKKTYKKINDLLEKKLENIEDKNEKDKVRETIKRNKKEIILNIENVSKIIKNIKVSYTDLEQMRKEQEKWYNEFNGISTGKIKPI